MVHVEGAALDLLYPKPSRCDQLTVLMTKTRYLIHYIVINSRKTNKQTQKKTCPRVVSFFSLKGHILDVGLFFSLCNYRFTFPALLGVGGPTSVCNSQRLIFVRLSIYKDFHAKCIPLCFPG